MNQERKITKGLYYTCLNEEEWRIMGRSLKNPSLFDLGISNVMKKFINCLTCLVLNLNGVFLELIYFVIDFNKIEAVYFQKEKDDVDGKTWINKGWLKRASR